MNRLKKRTCQLLVLVTTAGLLTGCGGGTPKLEDALKKTAAYEQETVTSPASDTLGGGMDSDRTCPFRRNGR